MCLTLIVCRRFGVYTELRSTDDIAQWIDDLAAFRAAMADIHDAAASLVGAVTPAFTTGAPLGLAA
jgi:hypothetical protein